MSADLLLTLNAGSSTVKIGLFGIAPEGPQRVARGVIDFRKDPARLRMQEGPGLFEAELPPEASQDMQAALAETFRRLAGHADPERIAAIGHRVVHGGDGFAGPVRIDDAALEAIEELTALAPLHQPQSLRLIRAIRALRPGLAQFASFDTAFHRTNPELVRRFAIPRALHAEGVKRYGFHGLSYKFVSGELARRAPEVARGRVVIAHLGSGASLCGLRNGVSQDSSMGFSTLDGIPMATRCGALDPGVLLHLLGAGRRPLGELEDMLYHRSGLLGVSGLSADSRELLESDRPEAWEAIDLFAFRTAGEIGRLTITLGGLDAVVFTAGIGENQPVMRQAICERLGWLGLELDAAANAQNAERITTSSSRVAAFVIPTDEEQVIAAETLAILGMQ
ncbi:acetate/propionate family kinase [Siccirubricoccus sp. KC 17139]|uniref:Acetate kinase n=1 Tax=Siccirubricoccus soli TaxID=2899147 RepID=A0ABT1DCE1_9PROT|nr:acetate/propionate family kinase [Siccirubricoccus soli]MCO6419613.1 acetate/propionate family kinase [Siccirubricoccus soli]MCP2685748.1 acetate/propionate family kinase [Siccirubricoccus soli]